MVTNALTAASTCMCLLAALADTGAGHSKSIGKHRQRPATAGDGSVARQAAAGYADGLSTFCGEAMGVAMPPTPNKNQLYMHFRLQNQFKKAYLIRPMNSLTFIGLFRRS